jgi:hypothetical protein
MTLKELGKTVDSDTKLLFDYLKRFDYETIKEYFDTVYGAGDNKRFDFELGYLCGTIENDGDGQPMLVDLQFTQHHLPIGQGL